MRDTTYRVLILAIAVWGALHIPTVLLSLSFDRPMNYLSMRYHLAPVSLALLPVAAIGLCLVRMWGIVALGLAFVFAIASYPPLAAFSVLIMLFTALRFWLSRHERRIVNQDAEQIAADVTMNVNPRRRDDGR